MASHAGRAVSGLPCELGTITATGVILDGFKHEIKDPLVLESLIDIDIELSLEVPAHEETGEITLPAIPSQADSPTVPGDYAVTFKFNKWVYDAGAGGPVRMTKARAKYKPQYQPGDRVLCALVNGGQEVVIVSRVVPYA
jgi:hypothetical protein